MVLYCLTVVDTKCLFNGTCIRSTCINGIDKGILRAYTPSRCCWSPTIPYGSSSILNNIGGQPCISILYCSATSIVYRYFYIRDATVSYGYVDSSYYLFIIVLILSKRESLAAVSYRCGDLLLQHVESGILGEPKCVEARG